MEHRPALCAGCQTPLTAAAAVVLRERRQVQELLPVRLQVTEHQALHLRCPVCQAVTAGTFSVEVPSRVQHGPRLRAGGVSGEGRALGGTFAKWVRQAAMTLEPVEAQIKVTLSQAPVLYNDETGGR